MSFCEQVKLAMAAKGISQAELARITGLSQQMLSKILLGKNSDVKLSTAIAIARALDVSLDYLGENE